MTAAVAAASTASRPFALLNPLLERRLPFEELKKQLPASGRFIDAAWTRDPKVIAEIIARAATLRGADSGASEENKKAFAAASELAMETGVIVVYQNFNAVIASHAVRHQRFLGCDAYSPTRMTWIKTSFTWAQYRSEWCTRDKDQSRCLAITLPIALFDRFLEKAVHSGAHEDGEGATAEPRQQKQQQQQQNNDDEDGGAPEATVVDAAAAAPGGVSKAAAAAKKQPQRSDPCRLQWDPSHSPAGGKLARRAIQLGIRGECLPAFHGLLLAIDDVTPTLVTPSRPNTFARQAATGKFRVGATPADDVPVLSTTAAATSEQADAPCLVPFESLYTPADPAIVANIALSVITAEQSEDKE